MATTKQTKEPEVIKSPVDIIREAQEIINGQTNALIGELQRQLQATADTVKMIRGITGKEILTDPAFGQALDEMGLGLKSQFKVEKKSQSKEMPAIKDTDLGRKITNVVKEKGKCDAASVIAAVGDSVKPNTIKNYLARLVTPEGVLYRPERGIFALK